MLKIGLIGCGFMGTMHANCYKNLEGVELAAVADLRREKAEEIAAQTEGAFIPAQFDNPENPKIHETTTAQEILADAGGRIDVSDKNLRKAVVTLYD